MSKSNSSNAGSYFFEIPPHIVYDSKQTPHKCPICEGTGLVPAGFYEYLLNTISTTPEQCKPCSGTGVI